jgi:subtilisin-like proprotein convertase family protein
VREIMKSSCDWIDTAGGQYDASGHSAKYGYGRLNAKKAVELARPAVPVGDRVVTATKDVPIRDFKTSRLGVGVAETASLKAVKVTVDIEHTYIGDLVVSIQPPAATSVSAIALHTNTGGGTHNLHEAYDQIITPALAALVGKKAQGTWTLVVKDTAAVDTGRIRSVSIEMRLQVFAGRETAIKPKPPSRPWNSSRTRRAAVEWWRRWASNPRPEILGNRHLHQ